MATSLPTNVDTSYPDTTQAEKLHQQHHDAIHKYTNEHDRALDPHGDRAYADQVVTTAEDSAAAAQANIDAHKTAVQPHTGVMRWFVQTAAGTPPLTSFMPRPAGIPNGLCGYSIVDNPAGVLDNLSKDLIINTTGVAW